jgi:uncharacterized phage-associated protein
MASALDVAKYILREAGSMTAMKLQKLVYYSQAWSLVWDDAAMFNERIEAWANGPVVRKLYNAHRGEFKISSLGEGRISDLSVDNRETIDAVLEHYGDKSAQWLSDLTHLEAPWLDARDGLSAGASSSRIITHASMAEYYSAL